MVIRCRRKTPIIEAIQWTGFNEQEIEQFVGAAARFLQVEPWEHPILYLNTPYGEDPVMINDYIFKAPYGGLYSYDCESFNKLYELVKN